MGVQPTRDFASLLDDLVAAAEANAEATARPSIPFDYLSVVEELHSGRIQVSSDAVAAEYMDVASDADLEELFAAAEPAEEAVADTIEALPVEPEAISLELNLDGARAPAEFARIRRAFAFANHPDRLPPHMRERAIQRMQVANMLIDEARRRALKGAGR
ncbi:MAG: hypothetical protein KF723_07830 [Rhizobiaceae bacterium]|nr:hypothetical protein [Rhizobiaceae bacterium]